MRIIEEDNTSFVVECSCGQPLFAPKNSGVVRCPHCGRERDPRRLRHKWARRNDPSVPNDCQAL